MLSRRLLRVKVMQMIYANTQQGEKEYSKIENELYRSITKAHELYHFILLLPVALRRHAARRIENGKNKLRPSKDELNPNMRFVNNKLVHQLENNHMLSDFVARTGLSWSNEEDLLKSVYARFCNNELYKAYMSERAGSYEDDKTFILRFLSKELPTFAFFFDGLENIGIKLDMKKNNETLARKGAGETVISTPDSPVKLFMIPTNEELVIVEDTLAIMNKTYNPNHLLMNYSFAQNQKQK